MKDGSLSFSVPGVCEKTFETINLKHLNPTLNSEALPEKTTPAAGKKNPAVADRAKSEKIRVELNVEKWPAMWRPASSNKAPTVRTLEREMKFSDGRRGQSKLEIGFTQFGTLTTEDQRMFYALIRQWEESGKPSGKPVYFSDRLLSRLLKKKGWGTNVIQSITASLRRLRLTPLRWLKAFHKQDGLGVEYEDEIPFTFLSDLRIITRRQDGHVTNQQGYFQFDRYMEANLLGNHTKPLFDEQFMELRTEIGQLLYTHVDLILSSKDEKGRMRTIYERRTRELFYDLGLLQENPSYRYPSNRKQALRRPVAELQGCRLSTGILKSIEIEKTKDGKDYKVVFRKGRVQDVAELLEAESAASVAAGTVVVNHYGGRPDPLDEQAEELLLLFHKLFHGVETHYSQTKEKAQALSLIAQHGFLQAKQVIEFAKKVAQDSNYTPQTFGGILHYTSRALSELEQKEHSSPAAQPVARSQVRESTNLFTRGEARLAQLTPEQYQRRADHASAELCRQRPAMARLIAERTDSPIVQRSIRALIVRQLEDEPMDLVPMEVIISVQKMLSPAQDLPL